MKKITVTAILTALVAIPLLLKKHKEAKIAIQAKNCASAESLRYDIFDFLT